MERLSKDGSRDRGGVGGGGRSPVGAIGFAVVLWWLSRDRVERREVFLVCHGDSREMGWRWNPLLRFPASPFPGRHCPMDLI